MSVCATHEVTDCPMCGTTRETRQGVGWIAQVLIDDQWFSWTQWKHRDRAREHIASLLKTGRYSAGRMVRVDWTVVEEVTP